MKNLFKITFLSLILILSIAQNTFANTTNDIIINGVNLKFRNIEKEKEYFKKNNQEFTEFIGVPYLEKGTLFLPVKKTLDFANINYLIEENNIYLYKDNIKMELSLNSNYISITNKNKKTTKHIINNPIVQKNNLYFNSNILKYLNFDIYKKDNIYYINYKNFKIEKINDKYCKILEEIKKDRELVNNKTKVEYFINDTYLPKTMILKTDDENIKISVPKGKYLENFHYGKMILLLDGKMLGYNTLERVKEKNSLSYYIKKDCNYILQQDLLEIADEILIYCPYCKSEYLIKIKNPFRKCDCE